MFLPVVRPDLELVFGGLIIGSRKKLGIDIFEYFLISRLVAQVNAAENSPGSFGYKKRDKAFRNNFSFIGCADIIQIALSVKGQSVGKTNEQLIRMRR